MPYGVELSVWRELVARYGSPREAVAAAEEVPGFGEPIKSIKYAIAVDDAYGRTEKIPALQVDLWALVVAALPPGGNDETSEPGPKDKGGRPVVSISKQTFQHILAQSLERARSRPPRPTYQEIADDAGVKRTWVTPIVKWAVKHQKEALHALAVSETPERFSTFVRD